MSAMNDHIAFARCAVGDCKFEAASAEPGLALAFVNAAFRRHAMEAHGLRLAQP